MEELAVVRHIDEDHPDIIRWVNEQAGEGDAVSRLLRLYVKVRDHIRYDPYTLVMDPQQIKASLTLQRGKGYCIEKSLLLAACGRVLGIPSRLGFSIVRNHISTEKFRQQLRSDLFVFHGYNLFFLHNRWVKCTPAFDAALCDRFGVAPLPFNGKEDSVFQEFEGGKQYMEYIHEYGEFDDLPYALFEQELRHYYPHLFAESMGTILIR